MKGIFGTDDLTDSDEDPSFDPANEVEDDEDVNLKKRKKTLTKKARNERHFADHAQEQRETTTTTNTTTQNTKPQRVNCEIIPCDRTFTRISDMKRHMKNVKHPTVAQKKTQSVTRKFLE